MNKVYVAFHNPMIHESAAYPISLHRSLEGAEEAIEEKKKEEIREIMELYPEKSISDIILDFHAFFIEEMEILP